MQSKQTRCASIAARLHGGAHAAVDYTTVLEVSLLKELSEILQTALNVHVKGYPHLLVSFHRRLQVYILFWKQVVSEKNHV